MAIEDNITKQRDGGEIQTVERISVFCIDIFPPKQKTCALGNIIQFILTVSMLEFTNPAARAVV